MDVASRSRSRVEERLTRIEEQFGPPEVTQTTFEVDEERYQQSLERSRDGQLDVRCVVRDDDGAVLLREGDGEWMVPRGQTRPDEQVSEAVERIVREAAGVDCTVTDAVRANIHGIRNEDTESEETVYRLTVVFTAEVVDSSKPSGESVRWDAEADAVSELV
ncbi:NUDIX domain-containing protein [Haloarcula sediminis]|uniref:NUDIX domain-containing protein n=1 Tax=Haloarcula sediminis TaxID=3111777 RepID=UPI002D77F701|nr:NUDIX domain-containing protein [Haloarcula sp. CK38]